ncbi:MAG: hypothetical protein LBU61_00450 [Coriobacteriales bacterium]|jgi:hypothetical protein|nr:hypothetical protein [Coriobacteriales bacterium]
MVKHSAKKKVISVLLSMLIAFSMVGPAFAAQKISNPDTRGGIDGIDSDPNIGVHNSYAWCSQVFQQADADYLWVGMNRDLGAVLFGASGSELPLELFGIPAASPDMAGKIYRQRASDSDAEWEFIYENPGISGYRKMIIFNDDLYVLAGLSNRRSLTMDYSIILRFSKDFVLGDTPEIVFWENVTGTTTEYFRSAAVLDGKLYIGTFDSKIYVTDGQNLTNLTPNSGPKNTGWSYAMYLPDYGIPTGGAVWDLLAFNGSVYAFIAFADNYAGSSGFGVYKITPNSGGYNLQKIVGDSTALYPYGMGITKNMTASGFLSTSFGEDYVYVSTFANGPAFLVNMAIGNYEQAFINLFCPAQIYRFDTQDRWEVVVGDTSGPNIAVDQSGAALPFVGNQRAGFFPQDDKYQNVSFNQYVWWMTEHDGKLYASTWDMGVFKQYYGLLSLYVFNDVTDNALMMLLGYVTAIQEQFGAIVGDYEGVDIFALASELGCYLQQVKDTLDNGGILETDEIIDGFIAILGKYFPVDELQELRRTVEEMVVELLALELDPCKVITDVLAFVSVTGLYFLDQSNPAGFDLFVSEDGRSFAPVTVDGFGDPCNYGGRVLVSSDHGLYVMTANPFNGGQVWRLSPMEWGVYPNGPEAIELLNKDATDLMTVLVTDVSSGNDLTLSYSSDIVEVSLVKRDAANYVNDITWDNQITNILGTHLKRYTVIENQTVYKTEMYDVVIKAIKSGHQELTLTFEIDGVVATRTIDVTVDIPVVDRGTIIVNGVELEYKIVNGVAVLEPTEAQMKAILAYPGNKIVVDLHEFAAIDFNAAASWFKDVDKTITFVSSKGSFDVKTKTLWNNSGKDRQVQVRDKVSVGNK